MNHETFKIQMQVLCWASFIIILDIVFIILSEVCEVFP